MRKSIPFLRQLAIDRQHGLCFYCSVRMWNASTAELPNPAPSTRAANRGASANLGLVMVG